MRASSSSNVFLSAAAIGFVAGLRSMTAPAVVSRAARVGSLELAGSGLHFLSSPGAANTFTTLAAGELVADKLPFIPNRTDPGPLIARIVSGGVCGAALAISNRESVPLAFVIAGLAAVAGTFAGYQVRHQAAQAKLVPDAVVALIEDAVAVLGGTLAVGAVSKEAFTAQPA